MNNQFRIVLVLLLSISIVQLLSNSIFIANTPSINKDFIAKLKDFPQQALGQLKRYYASKPAPVKKTDFATIEKLPDTALKSVAKGVYAYEEEGDIVYIRMTKDVEFEEREINYEGRKIKVRFPKGMLE